MALTYAIEGKGVIANCDAVTNDTGGTGTGDWTEQGGGTMSISNDVYLFNGASIGGKYASKSGFQQFDIGAGNELDFTATTGSESGQCMYMWVAMTALGTLDTLANYGLCIRLSSSAPGTTNYIDYLIAGNDGSNGWTGGWKCFVIDPTKTPSRVSGTQSSIIASVRTLGIWIDCSTSARADSIFIDQIAVGSGIRINGTSTTAWSDTVTYCTDYGTNRAWGMWQEREGIYYSYGKTYIGDATSQAANVSFADSGRIIQYGTSEYYESGAWKSSVPTTFSGIIVEDHTSYTTTFTDGVIVGTDKGRSGSVIIGNSQMDIELDLYGGNHADSATLLYGTTIKDVTGAINSGNDTGHKFLSCSFVSSSQFDPVGAPVIRNCIFAETADTDAALLWNENMDIASCSFIANTLGAGIQHPVITSNFYTHTDLVFSGNTYDVLNSANASTVSAGSFTVGRGYKILTVGSTDYTLIGAADNNIGTKFVATGIGAGTGTATDLLVITKGGTSNTSTSEDTGTNADELIQSSITITITVQDTATNPIQNVQTAIYKISDRTELMNEDTTAGGVATEDYTGTTPVDVEIRCRRASSGSTRYKNFSTLATLSSDFDLLITLEDDPNNNATS